MVLQQDAIGVFTVRTLPVLVVSGMDVATPMVGPDIACGEHWQPICPNVQSLRRIKIQNNNLD